MTRKATLRIAGYILFFLLLTLVFTVLNFPRENLTRTVNRTLSRVTNGALSVEDASLALPFSVRLSGVSLQRGEDRQMLGRALISPDLPALLAGKRGVVAGFKGTWGSSRFRLRSNGDGWDVRVKSLAVDLGALPLTDAVPFSLTGTAGMSGNLQSEDPTKNRLNGEGKITGEGIQVEGNLLKSLELSPLHFSGFTGFFTIKDNLLSLGENHLEGDLSVKARGTVRLVPNHLGNSRFDLTIEVKPGPDVIEKVAPLFSFIRARPDADGSVTFRLRGSFLRPSITG